MTDDLISTLDAAAELGIWPQAVRQRILTGTLPARKIGRDWFIARRDLEALKAKMGTRRRPGPPNRLVTDSG